MKKISIYKKIFVAIFGIFLLVFIGCDDSKKQTIETANTTSQTQTTQQIDTQLELKSEPKISDEEKYKDRIFKVTDVSEASIDGSIAIAITFSTPIKEKQKFGDFIELYTKTDDIRVDGGWEETKNKNEIVFKYLEPEKAYYVKIKMPENGGLLNIANKRLNIHYKEEITEDYNCECNKGDFLYYEVLTGKMNPLIGFASTASLLPQDIVEGLPVTTVNVDKVDIDFFKVDKNNLQEMLNTFYGKTSSYAWDANQKISSYAKLVYSGRFDLNPKKNTRENVLIPIKDIKELKQDGVYIAAMKKAGNLYQYNIPTTIFTISNIGIVAHKSGDDYDIFTQDLSNGKLLPNVDIEILTTCSNENGKRVNNIISGKTNDKGYANLSVTEDELNSDCRANALLATKNDQTSFITLNKPSLDLSDFSINGKINYDKTFFVFGPRDIYRPGEIVHVNALLRDSDGKKIPDQPIKVEIIQADNKVIRTFSWQGKDGFYQYNFNIPDNAPTGNWHLKFDLGDGKDQFYSFKVEDFMPEKMALEINTSKTQLSSYEDVVFDIYGKYLYGAPASENRLIGQISLKPLRLALSKELPDFYFGSLLENDLSRSITSIDTTLDKDGTKKINVKSDWGSIKSPVSVIFEASLMESGGRPVSRTIKQDIWPNDEIPAIRPTFGKKKFYDYKTRRYTQEFSVDENSFAEFEVVFTNKNGEKLSKDYLQVNLIKQRRDYHWYWDDYYGWSANYNERNIQIETFDISTNKGASTKIGFNVNWGPYIVEIVDKDTGATSSINFFAGYSWQDSSSAAGSRPEQIKLKIDKPSYRAGEKAQVTVEAPEAGNGYLMVENSEGILWWEEISVPKNGKTFSIPVDSEWSTHDIYISATVIREADKKSYSIPKRTMGIIHLPLNRTDKKIDVNLEVPKKIEPNKNVTIKLKANLNDSQKGKKIKAIVSAVDSGILSITIFQTPDPYSEFYGRREFSTKIYDVYGNIIEGSGKKANLKFGGDMLEDEALSRTGKKPVTKITIVSLQSDVIEFNENGEAHVSFKIPDFNGELRFMTQVWSDDDFANGEEKAIVADDIIVDLSHPRFLASKDKSTLALDLNNLSGKKQNLKVSLLAKNLLSIEGQKEYTVELDDKQKKTIYIPVNALNGGFGQGDIIVNVSGIKDDSDNSKTIQKDWSIGIRPPYAAQTFSYVKELKQNESFSRDIFAKEFKNLETSSIETQIYIANIPSLNIAEHIRQLYAYPYGCLEQTTSGIFPSIYMNFEDLKRMGITSVPDKDRVEKINIGISRILGMQKANGSFGFWSQDSEESFWGTVYATDFLIRAKEQGYSVPNEALERAIKRLQYYTNSNNIYKSYSYDQPLSNFAVRSYAAYVLARVQKASLGNLRSIYSLASGDKPALSMMYLGVALKLSGDNQRADELLKKSINSNFVRGDNYWYGDYGSNPRDKALMISLMYEYNLFEDQRAKMLLGLSEDIKFKSYLSTQERNSLFLAIRDVMKNPNKEWQISLSFDNKNEVVKSEKGSFNKIYNYKDIQNLKSITNSEENTLFATVNVMGYPISAPQPYSKGLSIERTYYSIDGRKVSLNGLNSGEMVIVVLKVKTDLDRVTDALVVDMLPAGFELENQNLGHSSINLQNSEMFNKNAALLNDMKKTKIVHQEYRDDRYVAAIDINKYDQAVLIYLARAVTPGKYTVPSPFVESMYSPDYHAIGKTESILYIK